MIPVREWDHGSYHRKFCSTYVWLIPEKPPGVPFLAFVNEVSEYNSEVTVFHITDELGGKRDVYLLNGNTKNPIFDAGPVVSVGYTKIPVGLYKLGDGILCVSRHVKKAFRQGFSTNSPFAVTIYPEEQNFKQMMAFKALKQPMKGRFHIHKDRLFYLNTRCGVVFQKEHRIIVDNTRVMELVRKEFPAWKVEV